MVNFQTKILEAFDSAKKKFSSKRKIEEDIEQSQTLVKDTNPSSKRRKGNSSLEESKSAISIQDQSFFQVFVGPVRDLFNTVFNSTPKKRRRMEKNTKKQNPSSNHNLTSNSFNTQSTPQSCVIYETTILNDNKAASSSEILNDFEGLTILDSKQLEKEKKTYEKWTEQRINQYRLARSPISNKPTPLDNSQDLKTPRRERLNDKDYDSTLKKELERINRDNHNYYSKISEIVANSPAVRKPNGRSRSMSLIDLTGENGDSKFDFIQNRRFSPPISSYKKRLEMEQGLNMNEDIDMQLQKLRRMREQYEKDQREKEHKRKLAAELKEIFPELTEQEEEKIEQALDDGYGDTVVSEKFNIQLKKSDILRLKDYEWLNDEVVNFYVNLLMDRNQNNQNMPKIFVFNTFFYGIIEKSNYSYSRVRKWTKSVDLFSLDKVIVPVHLGNHWCLAVVNFNDKKFEYYDSLGGDNPTCHKALRKYIADEYKDKKKADFDFIGWENFTPKNIPHQRNGYDCGVFMCKFADFISRNKPFNFSQKNMQYFRKRMVLDILNRSFSA